MRQAGFQKSFNSSKLEVKKEKDAKKRIFQKIKQRRMEKTKAKVLSPPNLATQGTRVGEAINTMQTGLSTYQMLLSIDL